MNRKRIIYSLVVVLLLNIAGPVAAQTKINDVPTDHWAYHAVTNAINKGYLTVFEDGRFKGADPVDRFTLATVISLLLEEVQVAQAKGTTVDADLIGELSRDFEKKLGNWYANEQAFRDDLQQLKENALSSEDRVSRVVIAQVELAEHVDELEQQLHSLLYDLNDLQVGIGVQSEDISGTEQRLEELLSAILTLDQELMGQRETVESQERAILSLENWAGEKGAVFVTLQNSNEVLSEEVKALKELNQQLETDVRNLAVSLRSESRNVADLSAELEQTKDELVIAQTELITLREDRSYLDDLKKQLSADTGAQMNAAIIREQRLERQIKEIEDEFSDYRVTAEKDLKSAKMLATVAIALAAIGAVIGFMPK